MCVENRAVFKNFQENVAVCFTVRVPIMSRDGANICKLCPDSFIVWALTKRCNDGTP